MDDPPPIDGLHLSPTTSPSTSPSRERKGKKQPGRTLETEDAPKALTFEDDYKLENKLSSGSFGIVYVTEHVVSGEKYAVKVIDKKRLSAKDTASVNREVTILMDCVNVENIVRLIDFYVSPTSFYVVQVLAQGGDVFERLASRTSYNEKDARSLAIHLIKAIEVLHSRKIVHRDLKPENLLLRNMLDDAGILLADFGFACYVTEEKLKTRCGTPAFVAPEVLVPNCLYGESCDMWSVGCLLYMLLGGYPPFQHQNHRGLFRKIRGADFTFHEAYWKNVSVSAKQLISSLLTVDPKYRCTAKMALEKSNWLKLKDVSLSEHDLSASIGEMKKFQARKQLKAAMVAVRWTVHGDLAWKKQIVDWDKNDEAAGGDKNDEAAGGATENDSLLTANRPTLKFADVYELKEKIHSSRSSTIWECIRRQGGVKLAVKKVELIGDPENCATSKSAAETVLKEVAVLKSLKHKYIIEIIDFFEEEDAFYLVMERMDGGDVFDRILHMKHYTEKDARDLSRFLLEAVACMHQSGIVHRDLKPQNLLLKSKEDCSDIKIADFKFASKVHTPQSLTTRCGTPTYVAPEVLKSIPYDQSVDMWSVGVIIYVLLCGYPPFASSNQSHLFESIRMGEWEFVDRDWHGISEDAKDLISKLLVVDPLRRLTAKDALCCKWLAQDDAMLSANDLSHSAELLKNRKTSLKTVARTIMWMGGSLKNVQSEEAPEIQEQVEVVLTKDEIQEQIEVVLARPESEEVKD